MKLLCVVLGLTLCFFTVHSQYFNRPPEPPVSRDFYKILGLPRSASTKDIKRRYRELSKEHHPDSGGPKEKFLDIRDAHEVLGNPEKRKIYDQYGEAGLDPNFQQAERHGRGFPFFHFPGGGPHGDGPHGGGSQQFFFFNGAPYFHASFDEGGHNPYQQQKARARDFYGSESPIRRYSPNELEQVIADRDWILLLQFYTPNCQECAKFQSDYEALYKFYNNIMNIGVVNCRMSMETCWQYKARSFPEFLLWLPPRTQSEPIVYDGDVSLSGLKEWLNQKIPLSATVLTGANIEHWLVSNPTTSKMIFATDKNVVPFAMRALAHEFSHRFKFAVVYLNSREGKKLLKNQLASWNADAGTHKIPALLHVTDIDKITGTWINFDKADKDVLPLKLSRISVQQRSRQSEAFMGDTLPELTKRRYQMGDCSSTEKKICLLFLLNGDISNKADCSLSTELQKRAKRFAQDTIKLLWINARKQASFVHHAFNISFNRQCAVDELCSMISPEETCSSASTTLDKSCIQVVAYNPKRRKYKVLQMDSRECLIDRVEAFVENVLGGMSLPHKIKGTLPPIL